MWNAFYFYRFHSSAGDLVILTLYYFFFVCLDIYRKRNERGGTSDLEYDFFHMHDESSELTRREQIKYSFDFLHLWDNHGLNYFSKYWIKICQKVKEIRWNCLFNRAYTFLGVSKEGADILKEMGIIGQKISVSF